MVPDDMAACPFRSESGSGCPQLLPVRIGLHDLRNSALGIRGLRDLLRANPDDPALSAAFDEVIDHLTAAVIALQSSLRGAPPTSLRWVDLKLAVSAAVLTSVPQQAQPYVDIQVGGGYGVITDPHLLHRVLDNLLRNASEALQPPERIAVRIAAGTGGGSIISICNRGDGVPDRTTLQPSAKGLGHGIALAAVRHLLTHHLGGWLTLECLDGMVTATVELPAEPAGCAIG